MRPDIIRVTSQGLTLYPKHLPASSITVTWRISDSVYMLYVFVFRNWHWDEPSCGYEVCVVMYHQPSAPPGLGGLYMFQWNDDNCETKNNFICKYTAGTCQHNISCFKIA